MAIDARYKISRERYDELVEELKYLQTVREKEVAELIKEARSFGDLSENSEYDEAKTEQGKLYSKIAEMKNVIDNAEIIEQVAETGIVSLGNRVVVRDMGSKEEMTYQIVGSQEANPMECRISDDSPIGRELVDKKVGDVITIAAPAGEFKYKILKIER